jgi:hypothetical protein
MGRQNSNMQHAMPKFIFTMFFLLFTGFEVYAQDEKAGVIALENNTIFIHGTQAFSVSRKGSQSYIFNNNSVRNILTKSKESVDNGTEGMFPVSIIAISPSENVKIKKQKYRRNFKEGISQYGTKVCSLKVDDCKIEIYFPHISDVLEMNSDKSNEACVIVEGIGLADVVTSTTQKRTVQVEYLMIVCKRKGQIDTLAKLVFWTNAPPISWQDNQTLTTLEEIENN